ncbi:MAG TPA: hypothetical protein VND96_01200 [Candidatus Micrarchaeaceae archaeon]|nr:hypothetical protein [Candidatus Micrarchaeaceae archaeon]
MKLNQLDWVAIYAAAVATIALGWQIGDRIYSALSHVRVYGEVTDATTGGMAPLFDVMGVTIINRGAHSIRVRAIVVQDSPAFRGPTWRRQMYQFMSGTDVAMEIGPHDSITSAFRIDEFRRLAGNGYVRVTVQLTTERWHHSRRFRPADRPRRPPENFPAPPPLP